MNPIVFRLLLVFILLPALGNAQITMPTSRIVFQRGNDNRASIPIQGNCPTSASSIQVKANALNGGTSLDWTTVGTTADGTLQSGVFMGNLTLSGGWYSIQVRALAGGSEVGNWSVDRVGVGEVFAIAGQSNILGSPYARNLSATDDRVSTVNYRGYPDGNITEGDLPTSFINATNNSPIGPENNMLFWGDLGDKLVSRLGVPVMFLGAAYAGTSSATWRDAANGVEHVGGLSRNAPYRLLGLVLNYYIKRTGIRSILWHQGESDTYTSQGEYVNNITQLINKTRSQTGMNRLAWMICRATYMQGQTNPNVIAAQNQLADAGNNCFPGPATDWMSGSQDWRFDDVHINDDKYPIFEGLFNDALSNEFFSNSQPSLPSFTPSITTGYIFPHERNGGDHIQVPYMATAPVRSNNQYVVQLLDENGNFLSDLGAGTTAGNNLIDVQLPVWADGRVRVRVNSTAPIRNGEVSEFFIVHKTGERPSDNPSSGSPVLNSPFDALNLVTGTAVNVNLPANFSDPANLALTYSWQNLPAGLSGSGLNIQGTVSGSARTETATLTATNSGGNSVNASIAINISNPAVTPADNVCSFTEGQFLFTFYEERIYAHIYNGILFAAYESPTSDFKPQSWVQQAGNVSGFDMSKVSCFATIDPRTSPPADTPTTPAPTVPAPVTPTTPTQSVIDPTGHVDISECGRQYGWARDAAVANSVVSVLVYWDNTLVSTLTADQYRNDLAAAFGDNGNHGFHYDTPLSLQSAENHQVKLQVEGAASPFHTATVYCANGSRVAAAETRPVQRSEISWLVFPNPVTNLLTLNVPPAYQTATLTLSVVNTGGKPVSLSELPASAGQRNLDVSALQPGVYILRVSRGTQTVTTLKVLKQ